MRRGYVTTVPKKAMLVFLTGVFVLFSMIPLAGDISEMGREPAPRFALSVVVICTFAVGYAAAGFLLRGKSWRVMAPMVVVEFLIFNLLVRRWPSLAWPAHWGAAEMERLHNRLSADAVAIVAGMAIGYTCFVYFSITEGRRYFRAHAEMALAREIHQVLVPAIEMKLGGYEFYGVSSPSSEVGGDLIDLAGSEANWVAYLADVSGHGVAPGVVMGMVKSAARMLLSSGGGSEDLMPRLNEVLYPLKKPDMFITFCFVAANEGKLRVGLAGHPAILQLCAKTNEVTEIACPNVPLGILADGDFAISERAAENGTLFALYTDGFVEAANEKGEEFGVQRLKEELQKHGGEPLQRICEAIRRSVALHGAQFDDQSILLIRKA